MSLFKEQRGVAEIIGFLIVTTALFGAVTYVLAVKGQQAEQQAQGLIDVMREAEMRQGELISYVYTTDDENYLKVYLYNYGAENVELSRVFIQGKEAENNWSYKDAVENGATYNSIPPSKLVEITFPITSPSPLENGFYLTILTKHRGVYCWWIS